MKLEALWHKIQGVSPFGSHVLLTAGTNVVVALLTLVTGILAARLLGPEGRGELAAIQVWPSFIATVAMLGLAEALVYFSAREPDRAGCYMGSAMALGLISALPFMGIGYVAMPFLLSAQSPEVTTATRWYLLLVPLFALVPMLYHPLQGRNDLAIWNGLRILPSTGWLAVLVLAWLLQRREPPFVAASYLVMLALLFFPLMYIVSRRVPGPFWPDAAKWGQMVRYGLPSVLSSMPQMLNLRLDQMLMTAFLPLKMLGMYVVAVAWSNAGNPLLNALGAVLFPGVASQQTPAQQNRVLARGSRLGVLVSVVIGVVLMVVTPGALPLLFGIKFAPAIPAALVLVVAGAIAGLKLILIQGIRGLGHPAAVMWSEFGGLMVTGVSLLLLLRPLGIMGAALASLLGYSTAAVLLIVQIRQLTGYSLASLLCPTVREVTSGWERLAAVTKTTAK